MTAHERLTHILRLHGMRRPEEHAAALLYEVDWIDAARYLHWLRTDPAALRHVVRHRFWTTLAHLALAGATIAELETIYDAVIRRARA